MRRLGLDIGTNSIGWCLVEYDDAHPIGTRVVDIGARIFSDGRDPKSGASLAVDRRAARAMRRRRDRYIGRRDAFLKTLIRYGLMPGDPAEAKALADLDPYDLRARALKDKLKPFEIGRALFHLNQRRGFLSNRKAERRQKDSEDGKIKQGEYKLDQAMAEDGADTLGQFLSRRDEKRVRLDSESQSYDFYPQRRHIHHEFDTIWAAQAKHHPALLTDEAKAALRRILFFQRPLKDPIVGKCTFVNSEDRLPKAHPLFQERRLYEEVNHLEITAPGEKARPLTLDQRDALICELRGRKERSFAQLGKRLKLQPGESFNKATETRTHLAGNEVYAALAHKDRFGQRWDHVPAERQWVIIERLMEEENPEALHAFLLEEGLNQEQARETAKARLPEGYGRLGETATRLILAELRKEVISYDKAVERALGRSHSREDHDGGLAELPYYGEILAAKIPPGSQLASDPPETRFGKITNPTVHIGLRQLEKLVNAIIAVHGKPDQIVVELARELKLNEKDKEEHNRRIRKDTADAQRRSRALTGLDAEGNRIGEAIAADTGANRALLKLWEELNQANPLDRRCPYCAEPIGVHALFAGEADVDHIIPYSRSLDDSASNKVVAHRRCNRAKGNRTPFERWGHEPERWDLISAQVARLHKGKQWRFGPDAMARVEKDGGFLARQLVDTQYLSGLARDYLSRLYPEKGEGSGHVYVIPGRMTAMLRRLWGLNSLLPDHNFGEQPKKNRLDHRHHAIDAAVTAVTTRSLLNEIARVAGQAEDRDLDRLFEDLEQPWDGFREELQTRLANVTVSHKPDHGRKGRPAKERDVTSARLHDDTAYGLTGEVGADGRTPVVVKRVNFLGLDPRDVADKARIRDPKLRAELQQATAGHSGAAFQQALKRFAATHPLFRGIRHVRVLGERPGTTTLSVIPIAGKDGRPYKAYKGNANARFLVWRMPDGSWKHATVSIFREHQRDAEPSRPHPAAKKILDLRQNDLIAIERGGPREIMRVVKFSGSGQITLAAHNEAGALKARDAAPNDLDPFKYVAPTAGGLKKLKARQVRIDPLGRIFDPGPR